MTVVVPRSQRDLSVHSATVNFPERKALPMSSTITNPYPDLPLPAGAVSADTWQEGERLVFGPDRSIIDSDLNIWTSAIQLADGRIDTEQPEPPKVHIEGGVDLNSDQARELASALLEAAAEVDSWCTR